MSTSLSHTPFAALARPIAGTIRGSNTLVVTLPGSVKAVRENLAALLGDSGFGVIGHALELLCGSSGQELHTALAGGTHQIQSSTSSGHDSGHAHHHHHHPHSRSHNHGDLSTGTCALTLELVSLQSETCMQSLEEREFPLTPLSLTRRLCKVYSRMYLYWIP